MNKNILQNTLEAGEPMPSSENGLIMGIRKYLDGLEKGTIYYPFEYERILILYGLRETKGGKELINKKQELLKQVIAAIEQEKEGGFWELSESNRDMLAILRELTKEN